MFRLALVAFALIFTGTAARAETPPPVLALKGLDPVELVAGKEIAGLETLELTHGRFRYRFATAENQKAFESKPETFRIQFGGACGKMGPLSGQGNPECFFIHDRRIYVFASEGCRDGFMADPAKHIELPNPVPTGMADEMKRGRELLERALVGFGGAKVVDDLSAFQSVTKLIYKQGGKEVVGTQRITWSFPDKVRYEADFGTNYGHVVNAANGFEFGGTKSWPMEAGVRDVAWRQALRDPLAMLRNRGAKGFTAIARGKGMVDDITVELLDVALDGATTTWSIDPKTGRVLQVAFHARRGTLGDNRVRFDDFREVNGVTFPYKRTESFNGKIITSPEVKVESITLNGKPAESLFVEPK